MSKLEVTPLQISFTIKTNSDQDARRIVALITETQVIRWATTNHSLGDMVNETDFTVSTGRDAVTVTFFGHVDPAAAQFARTQILSQIHGYITGDLVEGDYIRVHAPGEVTFTWNGQVPWHPVGSGPDIGDTHHS